MSTFTGARVHFHTTLVVELSCPEGTCDAVPRRVNFIPAMPRDLTLPARRHLRSE
jgi:hypothetical protein